MKLLKTQNTTRKQTNVKELDKKTSNATTLIRINQYNTVKQNLEKCS